MQVLFESRGSEGVQLRELAVRRLRFVMRRVVWLVPRARVRLVDVNGTRGGMDKRCQVELETGTIGTVTITALAHDWPTALDTALGRSKQALMRTLRRARDDNRSRRPAVGIHC